MDQGKLGNRHKRGSREAEERSRGACPPFPETLICEDIVSRVRVSGLGWHSNTSPRQRFATATSGLGLVVKETTQKEQGEKVGIFVTCQTVFKTPVSFTRESAAQETDGGKFDLRCFKLATGNCFHFSSTSTVCRRPARIHWRNFFEASRQSELIDLTSKAGLSGKTRVTINMYLPLLHLAIKKPRVPCSCVETSIQNKLILRLDLPLCSLVSRSCESWPERGQTKNVYALQVERSCFVASPVRTFTLNSPALQEGMLHNSHGREGT